MDDEDQEIVDAFLAESHEGLDELDRALVALESEPDSRELLSAVFRTVHTIKGTSGFLAFARLESLTHVGENLLSALRDGELAMNAPITDALLAMVDAVRGLLDEIARTGTDAASQVDVDAVLAVLSSCVSAPTDVASVDASDELAASGPDPEPVVHPVALPEPAAEAAVESVRPAADATVRVDVELLDTLVRLVGELVLTRNQIVQRADDSADAESARAAQRLDVVASELQENVMRTRMQPIGQAWTKFPRMVRDLGAQLGKTLRLEMSGQETELDRTLLEAVKDPLTHLVRNAIDHGIEHPDVRAAAGKSPVGTLALRAYHESGQVVVEISDDGKGLDPAVIGAVAVRRGVVTDEQLHRMSEREINELIFAAGFSTAAAVTNVSGRGVGMDVVRTNIERIGGVVELTSTPGLGTTFRVRIPLTLAIIPALVIGQSGERYCIPQANLVELTRMTPAEAARDVSVVAGAAILRLRGQLLPLVALADAMDVARTDDENVTVVVVQAGGTRFGVVVDEVHDTQEIVVKPLGRQLKSIAMYAGATIMGDGRVSLILDVGGLAHDRGMADAAVTAHEEAAVAELPDSVQLLVLDVGDGGRAALPLQEVARLEEFTGEQIERSGSTQVVQYRDGILPLVRLDRAIGLPPSSAPPELLPVVVHELDGRRVGIVADRIVDVVDVPLVHSPVGARAGVLGTTIIQDRVTDVVDVDAVVATVAGAR